MKQDCVLCCGEGVMFDPGDSVEACYGCQGVGTVDVDEEETA